MRRRLVLIAMLLIGGAIVNVAVAWGCAARRAFLTIERYELGYAVIWNRPWQFVQERQLGMIDLWWYNLYDENPLSITPQALVADGEKRRARRQEAGQTMPSARPVATLNATPHWGSLRSSQMPPSQNLGGDIACGWPLVCLWMSTTGDVILNKTANEQLHGAWLVHGAVSTRGNDFIALPYRPLWLNLLINSIFYAFMTFVFPIAFRRRRRLVRGLCPVCAYPVGTSPVCTECGQPVKFQLATGESPGAK